MAGKLKLPREKTNITVLTEEQAGTSIYGEMKLVVVRNSFLCTHLIVCI